MISIIKKKAKALCVPLREAEPVRRYLRQSHLLQEDLKILKEKTSIYFPVKDSPGSLPSYKVVTKSFETKQRKPHSYKELLTLPKNLRDILPTSYDTVGAIILIKLPEALLQYRTQIGNALLQTHTNIQTVCHIDAVSGELRTRKIEIIAGKNQTLTTHREYGLTLTVDVATTYFSPRLATERKRVADLVKLGETVVDMFTGVAPFSIMIARFAKPSMVYAIDKNKEAIRLARQNIKQNHVLENVEVIQGDATDALKLIPEKADRIIMNLPLSAHLFFAAALSIAAPICIVHYYDILQEEEIEKRITALKKIAREQGYFLKHLTLHKIKSYAPREFYIGLDITATKHADVA
jgi:tRNA (guanine37-N1)-methyltransferase